MSVLPQALPLPLLVKCHFLTKHATPQALGVALFLSLPHHHSPWGYRKPSGSAPVPLKGLEPIQGLCSEGTKWEAGVGSARTLPYLLHHRVPPSL